MDPIRPSPDASGPNPELLWKQQELFTDLLKHYLKLVIEVNALYYAVTGGIVSFYFSKANGVPRMKWALVIPIAMSLVLGSIFAWATCLSRNMQQEMKTIAGALGLRIYPAAQVLTAMLWGFAILFFMVAVGLLVVGCGGV